MNAYQRRLAAKVRTERPSASELKRIEAHALAKRYEAARLAATGEDVVVKYTNGWFRFVGRMYRRVDFECMTKVMEARAAALINPDEGDTQ